VSPKYGCSVWKFFRNSGLRYDSGRVVVDNIGRRWTWPSVVSSPLTSRPSFVDHIQRPALCTVRWKIGRDAARRAVPSASAETCSFPPTGPNVALVLVKLNNSELSMGWVDPWVALGRKWVENFCF